jgi:hypothetical protein
MPDTPEPRTTAGRTLERIVRNAMPAADGVADFIVRIESEARASLDVMTLRRALERGLSAVDDEWTIEELAELSATEYARLAEEPHDA